MSDTRFVILPGDNRFNFRMRTASLDALPSAEPSGVGEMAGATLALGTARRAAPRLIEHEIARIGDDEALLVSLTDDQRLGLQRQYPGLRIVQEGTARMAMQRCEMLPIPTSGMASTRSASRQLLVTVVDESDKPLRGVPVYALVDVSTTPPTGSEARTDAHGVANFPLPAKTKLVRVLAVPEKRFWTASWSDADGSQPKSLKLVCHAIDPRGADGLRCLHTAGAIGDGAGVTVAVIDGGASHAALDVAAGANLTEGEDESDWNDNGVGHGTHVAGVIAAQPDKGYPAGLAPGVRLLVYRVFGRRSLFTGSFAVAAAIRQAVDAGADLINMSFTLDGDVTLTEREIKRARAMGVLCIAAAGNSASTVRFPARFSNVVGVSAIAARKGWPREAHEFDVNKAPKAKGHPELAVASFTCHGPEIDFAAPGVGVVSLLPERSFGAMNGTSMASPAITGLIARMLAREPDLLDATRDQERSDRIMKLATAAAASIGLPAQYQGHGILSTQGVS